MENLHALVRNITLQILFIILYFYFIIAVQDFNFRKENEIAKSISRAEFQKRKKFDVINFIRHIELIYKAHSKIDA